MDDFTRIQAQLRRSASLLLDAAQKCTSDVRCVRQAVEQVEQAMKCLPTTRAFMYAEIQRIERLNR